MQCHGIKVTNKIGLGSLQLRFLGIYGACGVALTQPDMVNVPRDLENRANWLSIDKLERRGRPSKFMGLPAVECSHVMTGKTKETRRDTCCVSRMDDHPTVEVPTA